MQELMHDSVWFNQPKYEEAEALGVHHTYGKAPNASVASKGASTKDESCVSPLINQIVKARENILQTLGDTDCGPTAGQTDRISQLEKENKELKKIVETLTSSLSKLEIRVQKLEGGKPQETAPEPVKQATSDVKKKDDDDDDDFELFGSDDATSDVKKKDDDDDDDFELFGSDNEEDEDKERVKNERIAKYNEKKAKKPALIAKSTILLDVKPWDDETDLGDLEQKVRSVETDGLLWGASQLVPIAYGIMKLRINCVVEDDKVGTDFLEENITAFEDHVQSVDVVSFNKI